jgi:hypothetical protein
LSKDEKLVVLGQRSSRHVLLLFANESLVLVTFGFWLVRAHTAVLSVRLLLVGVVIFVADSPDLLPLFDLLA